MRREHKYTARTRGSTLYKTTIRIAQTLGILGHIIGGRVFSNHGFAGLEESPNSPTQIAMHSLVAANLVLPIDARSERSGKVHDKAQTSNNTSSIRSSSDIRTLWKSPEGGLHRPYERKPRRKLAF